LLEVMEISFFPALASSCRVVISVMADMSVLVLGVGKSSVGCALLAAFKPSAEVHLRQAEAREKLASASSSHYFIP